MAFIVELLTCHKFQWGCIFMMLHFPWEVIHPLSHNMNKFHSHEFGDEFEWEGLYYAVTPLFDDPNSLFNLPHMLVCCGGVDDAGCISSATFLNSLSMNIVLTVYPPLACN